MSASGEYVDWNRAERDERRRQLWGWPFAVAYFAGLALTRGGSPFGSGRWGWVLLLGYLAFMAVLIAVIRSRPQARARAASSVRSGRPASPRHGAGWPTHRGPPASCLPRPASTGGAAAAG